MCILISPEEESDFDDIYEPLVEDQQQDNLDDEEIDQGEMSNEETQDVPISTSWSSNARDFRKSLKFMLSLVKEKLEKILKVSLLSLKSSSCLLLKLS